METATLAGGCFWCTEAIFQRLKGVTKVTPGYCDDAESIQFEFDPKIISYSKLLDIFFHLHDPTTLNRQNYDIGPEYRSAIFYHDKRQKKIAEETINKLQISGNYPNRIVTEVTPYKNFSPAEKYHQDFYNRNRAQPYCQIIIDPKIQKLLQEYKEDVKV